MKAKLEDEKPEDLEEKVKEAEEQKKQEINEHKKEFDGKKKAGLLEIKEKFNSLCQKVNVDSKALKVAIQKRKN